MRDIVDAENDAHSANAFTPHAAIDTLAEGDLGCGTGVDKVGHSVV